MLTRDEAIRSLTAAGAAFELRSHRAFGRDLRVFAVPPFTLREALEMSRRHGNLEYLVFQNERYTYADNFRLAVGLAHALSTRYDIHPGDRVAIAMRNYPEFAFTFWAVMSLGAVLVPLNAWGSADDLEFGIRNSGSRCLFVDSERLRLIEPRLSALGLRGVVSVREEGDFPGVTKWTTLAEQFVHDAPLATNAIDPDSDATILYTSGTTGNAKGAVHTHRNHCTNLLAMQMMGSPALNMQMYGSASNSARPAAPPVQPAMLGNMPFFHIGQLASLYLCAGSGTKLVLMYRWDPEIALDLTEKEGITVLNGVPMMMDGVLNSPSLKRRDLSRVRAIMIGATAVPPALVRRVQTVFDGRIVAGTGYGMTESTSGITLTMGQDYLDHPGSVGMLNPVMQAKILDEQGVPVKSGEVGELWVYGPNVIRGYWNDEAATEAAFRDGWVRTGDLMRMDDEGRLYLVDRIKDIIIRGGENIYSGEVESCLYAHEAVMTASVLGLPHPTLGEEVAAVIRLRPDMSVTAQEIKDFCKSRLAGFKVPTKVLFVAEDLPRTPTGKILKRVLRERLARAVWA